MEANTLEIAAKTVVFSVTRGRLPRSAKLKSGQVQVLDTATGKADETIDKASIKASAVLFECEEVAAVQTLDSQVTKYLDNVALPFPFKTGLYLLTTQMLVEVDVKMHEFATTRAELVAAIKAAYSTIMSNERKRLGSAFGTMNYPTVDELDSRYHFTWRYFDLDLPSNEKLPPEIREAQRRELEAMWKEAADGIRDTLRYQLADLVGHLSERLSPTNGSKPKIFRDSAVANVKAFLDTFDARNVTNDAECALLVQTTRQLLNNISPSLIRNDNEVKELARDAFGEIKTRLDTMLVDRPQRKFKLKQLEEES